MNLCLRFFALALLVPGTALAQATRLSVAEGSDRIERFDVMESLPVQFAAFYIRHHDSTGWRVLIDSVEVAAGRIVATIEETPPTRPGVPGPATTEVRLHLGSLAVGPHLLVIRKDLGGGTTSPIGAFLLQGTGAPGQIGQMANNLQVAETPFTNPQVMMAKSLPPAFFLSLVREMPTPGWSFEVDSVEREGDRIVARVTEKRPDGMAAQVMTPTSLRVPLGRLPTGMFLLIIETRRDEETYRPIQGLIVEATR